MSDSFKVRNPEGLYSDGGSSPTFSKTGKSWGSLPRLRNHLNLVNATFMSNLTYGRKHHYEGCEIVRFTEAESFPVTRETVPQLKRRADKLAERAHRYPNDTDYREALDSLEGWLREHGAKKEGE